VAVHSACSLEGKLLRWPSSFATAGDPEEPLNRLHIRQVNVLALAASALAVVLFLGSRLLVTACCGSEGAWRRFPSPPFHGGR
jgi:hypothetical protein